METQVVQTVVEHKDALSRLLDIATQFALTVLPLIASWAALKLGQFFTKRTNIEIPLKQYELLDEWVLKGIHYAEEKARQFAKTDEVLAPPSKLATAADFVLSFIEQKGWVGWTRDRVEKYIEAKLNMERGKPAVEVAAAISTTGGSLPK